MTHEHARTMRAVAIDEFGGPERLTLTELPVPDVGRHDVLIALETAGVGEWDPFEREGGYAEMLGIEAEFPYVLGSEGAGVIVTIGEQVERFEEGDRVYAAGFLNPSGGFYAEYASVNADLVSAIPDQLTTDQAGAMSGAAITALRGLDDTLDLQPSESVVVVGASGGVGHVAVQLAKRVGTRVLAVASGDDGVALAERLGADVAVDGHADGVRDATRSFAPDGVDAVLLTAGGAVAEQVLTEVREDGRVAFPTGVQPEPDQRPGLVVLTYNGSPDREIIQRLDRLIAMGPFEVHIASVFALAEAREAHLALEEHHLGKIALRMS